MHKLELAAEFSVARASAFGGLGIAVIMIAMFYEPRQSFQIGGILCIFAALILVLKAQTAGQTPYKHTEVWLLLDQTDRPGPDVAQKLITVARRSAFLKFAYGWAQLGVGLLSLALFSAVMSGRPV